MWAVESLGICSLMGFFCPKHVDKNLEYRLRKKVLKKI